MFEPVSGNVGFVVDKVTLGQVFSEYFDLSYQFGILYQPLVMDDECAAVDEMSGRGNQNTRRKLALEPLCPSQIPHDLTWTRI
jgi:hypothetical protein